MDTSDRQVAETGRNRELGLIPAMVMAVVATLSGAGVSFAPLYERIWGGMMLHPNCPAIGRMTYYLSGQATDDYGACVTSPLWFMTVTALSVVAILCLTVAGVQGFSRHRLCSVWCNTPLLPSTRKTTVIESRQNAVVYGLPPCTTCSTPSASTHPPYAIALFPLPCSGQVSRSLPTATTLVDTPISAQRYRQLTMQVLSLIASAMKLWDC